MGHSELKGVLVLLLSSCGACALQAEDDIAGGSTASLRAVSCAPAELIDDFNDGAAQGWVVGNPFGSPGTWSVVDGAYTFLSTSMAPDVALEMYERCRSRALKLAPQVS